MDTKAHSYHPKDNSQEAKFEAFVQVLREYRNAAASMDLANKNEAHERLGTKEEIEYAFRASQNTIEKGLKSLSSAEIEYVQTNLLSPQEAQELEKLRRQEMMKSSRTTDHSKENDFSKDK